jgi:hypothetical protein
MEKAKRFYCDLLGFEVAWEAAGGGQHLEDLTHVPGLHEHCVQITVPGGCRIEPARGSTTSRSGSRTCGPSTSGSRRSA